MEETKRKFPSLPPNYVSLQQLQQQRLRKQQQKEEEEEEQRLEEEKEKQQPQQAEEEEEKKKKLLVSQKTLPRIKSYDQTYSNRNGRNFSQKSWLIKEKNEAAVVLNHQNPDQKLEEVEPKENNEAAVVGSTSQKKKKNKYKRNGTSEIHKVDAEINEIHKGREAEINVAVESEQLPDLDHQNLKEIETKKKKKKKKYKKGKKPMVVEDETLIEETLIEEDMKESLPPATTIPNENVTDDVKNTRTGFRRRRYQKPPSESVNQTMVIVEKIGDLKICDDDDDDKKSTVEKKMKNDYYSCYSRVMRSRKMINRRKPMVGNLMWIRKDEKTDGFPAGKFENRF